MRQANRGTPAHTAAIGLLLAALPLVGGGWTYCGSWAGDETFNVCLPEVAGSCTGTWSSTFSSTMGTWNSLLGTPTFWQYTTPAYAFGPYNGINEASFSDHATVEAWYGPFSASAIGVLWPWSDVTCGTRIEMDLFIFTDVSWTTDRLSATYGGPYFYQEVVLHELGHAATLDHESGLLTIMNPSANVPGMLPYPHVDEISAIIAHSTFAETAREDHAILPYDGTTSMSTPDLIPSGTVYAGDTLTVDDIRVENWGTLGARDLTVTWVLSSNNIGSSSDTILGSTVWYGAGWGYLGAPLGLTVPSVSVGTYYVIGVIDIAGAVSDWYTVNDQVVVGSVYVGCADEDGDGYTSSSCGGSDCDDNNAGRYPGRSESCDGDDDDCDYVVDDGVSAWWARDDDDDSYGDDGTWVWGCSSAITPAQVGGDCDDSDPSVHPNRSDNCDGIDEDCDLSVDEDDQDNDGDGSIDPACGGDDCDDNDADRSPQSLELCDGIDQDCDGAIDDGVTSTWWRDEDGDGYGLDGDQREICEPSAPYSASRGGDCDDGDSAVHPDREDTCDGIDGDCDGSVDEDCEDDVDDGESDEDESDESDDEGDSGDDGKAHHGRNSMKDQKGCGCASSTPSGGLVSLLVVAALLRWRRALSVFVVLIGLFASTGVWACTLPLTELDLIGLSEVIVEGRVVDMRIEPWGPAGVPVTRVRVAVDEVWRGEAGAVVELWQPGGAGQGAVYGMSGAVHYAVGAEMVLFLERSPSGVLVTAGLDQGAWVVDGGHLVPSHKPSATSGGDLDDSAQLFAGARLEEVRSLVLDHVDAPWPAHVPRIAPLQAGHLPAAIPSTPR